METEAGYEETIVEIVCHELCGWTESLAKLAQAAQCIGQRMFRWKHHSQPNQSYYLKKRIAIVDETKVAFSAIYSGGNIQFCLSSHFQLKRIVRVEHYERKLVRMEAYCSCS